MSPLCFHDGQNTEGLVFCENLNMDSAEKVSSYFY